MWCISNISGGFFILEDYDTGEWVEVLGNSVMKYHPVGTYMAGNEIRYTIISEYCYRLFNYVDITEINERFVPDDVNSDDVLYWISELEYTEMVDGVGVVWKVGAIHLNLLAFLFLIENKMGINVVNYKKLVIYFKKRNCTYIFNFDKGFKAFFGKVRLMTVNGILR